MPENITFIPQKGLQVPDHPLLGVLPGDGIGPEITRAVLPLLDAAVQKAYNGQRSLTWKELAAGSRALQEFGAPLPQSTLEELHSLRIALKGPLTTPVGQGMRSLNVTLRQTFDLYACVRPVRYFEGVASPVKHPERVDMTIFRENTEDLYSGIEWDAGTPEAQQLLHFLQQKMNVHNIRFPENTGFGIKPISKEGSQRLIRSALDYAIAHHRHHLTIVHKGNIMKYTEGAFRRYGFDLVHTEYQGRAVLQSEMTGKESSDTVIVNDCICDDFLQQTLLHPQNFEVIAATNLNGDYISDAIAAQVGGIGIAPGANINPSTGYAIFESTHGSAPKIAGQNKANPSGLLLSGCMLLEHIGWHEASRLLTDALANLLKQKIMTCDLAEETPDSTCLGTREFADRLLQEIMHSSLTA